MTSARCGPEDRRASSRRVQGGAGQASRPRPARLRSTCLGLTGRQSWFTREVSAAGGNPALGAGRGEAGRRSRAQVRRRRGRGRVFAGVARACSSSRAGGSGGARTGSPLGPRPRPLPEADAPAPVEEEPAPAPSPRRIPSRWSSPWRGRRRPRSARSPRFRWISQASAARRTEAGAAGGGPPFGELPRRFPRPAPLAQGTRPPVPSSSTRPMAPPPAMSTSFAGPRRAPIPRSRPPTRPLPPRFRPPPRAPSPRSPRRTRRLPRRSRRPGAAPAFPSAPRGSQPSFPAPMGAAAPSHSPPPPAAPASFPAPPPAPRNGVVLESGLPRAR